MKTVFLLFVILNLFNIVFTQNPYIWPLPKSITISPTLNIDLASQFQITTKSTSQILQKGINRYLYITFPHLPENESKASTLLSSLVVTTNSDDETLQYGIDESYSIKIDSNSNTALLNSNTIYGALKGLETFSQIVLYNFTLGYYQTYSCNIMDEPRFKWRGILIDTSRHFQSVQSIKKVLNGMEYAKFNILHWHS